MYIHIYIYIRIHIHIHMHKHTHIYRHTYMQYTHMNVHTCEDTHAHVYLEACSCFCLHLTYAYTYINICNYVPATLTSRFPMKHPCSHSLSPQSHLRTPTEKSEPSSTSSATEGASFEGCPSHIQTRLAKSPPFRTCHPRTITDLSPKNACKKRTRSRERCS